MVTSRVAQVDVNSFDLSLCLKNLQSYSTDQVFLDKVQYGPYGPHKSNYLYSNYNPDRYPNPITKKSYS